MPNDPHARPDGVSALAFYRGGPGTHAGLRFQIEYGVSRVLSLVAAERGVVARSTVLTEPRHLVEAGQIGFDLGVHRVTERRHFELKYNPTSEDVRGFVASASAMLNAEPEGGGPLVGEVCLVVAQETAAVAHLDRVRVLAGSTTSEAEFIAAVDAEPNSAVLLALVSLGGVSPRQTFARTRVEHMPVVTLRSSNALAAAIVAGNDEKRGTAIRNAVAIRLLEGGVERRAIPIDGIISELEAADLLPPLQPWSADDLGYVQHDAVTILGACRYPVPGNLLAAALAVSEPQLANALADLVTTGRVEAVEGGWVSPLGDSLRPRAGSRAHAAMLEQYLSRTPGSAPLSVLASEAYNVATLAALVIDSEPELAARSFVPYDKPSKATGDLSLVWRLASLTVRGVDRALEQERSAPDLASHHTRALICGSSWVAQRVGHLEDALRDLDHARRLNRAVADPVSEAFILKCSARVHRLLAESYAIGDPRRAAELGQSRQKLVEAYKAYLPLVAVPGNATLAEEPGDCLSLAARTELAAGDRAACDELRARAHAELDAAHRDSKAFADLVLLDAEIGLVDIYGMNDPVAAVRGAASIVSDLVEVLRLQSPGKSTPFDTGKSEIIARAYELSARANVVMNDHEEALRCFEAAAAIYDRLPAVERAYRMHDEVLALAPDRVPQGIDAELSEDEAPGVRHEAVVLHLAWLGEAPGRSEPLAGTTHWTAIVAEARIRAESRHARWRETAERAA